MQTSHKFFIFPPSNPVKPTVVAWASLATSNACTTLGELPLALMDKSHIARSHEVLQLFGEDPLVRTMIPKRS